MTDANGETTPQTTDVEALKKELEEKNAKIKDMEGMISRHKEKEPDISKMVSEQIAAQVATIAKSFETKISEINRANEVKPQAPTGGGGGKVETPPEVPVLNADEQRLAQVYGLTPEQIVKARTGSIGQTPLERPKRQ